MKENIEKIFNRCLKLIEKEYSIEYCLKKYSKYKTELQEYFNTMKYLNNLKNIEPEDMNISVSLDKIYSAAENITEPAINKIKHKTKTTNNGGRIPFLKPAIVFTSILIVLFFSFAGTLYASQDSLPGENLYPVKRAAENIQLFLWPESRKGQVHFKFLNNRIYEADTLMESEEKNDIELIEELIIEIDKEYYKCKEYNFFTNKNEEGIVYAINDIKNKYKNKYKYRESNQNTEEYNIYNGNNDNSSKETTGNEGNTEGNGRNRKRRSNEK